MRPCLLTRQQFVSNTLKNSQKKVRSGVWFLAVCAVRVPRVCLISMLQEKRSFTHRAWCMTAPGPPRGCGLQEPRPGPRSGRALWEGLAPHGRLRPPLTDGGRKPRCSNWYVTVSDQEMLRNRKESSTLVSMYRDFVINICPRGMYFYNRSGAPSNSSVLEESNNRCL